MAQALNSDLGINERREPKEFPAVVEFFKTVKNIGIKKVLFKALADYLKATNFQIGKETIATLRSELSRDSGEPQQIDTTGAEAGAFAPTSGLDAYSKPGEPEDIKGEPMGTDAVGEPSEKMSAGVFRRLIRKNYEGTDFKSEYNSFIRDLKQIANRPMTEITSTEMASELGTSAMTLRPLLSKYKNIFAAIAKIDGKTPEGKQFLSRIKGMKKTDSPSQDQEISFERPQVKWLTR
jgi:hypothetical protein